MLVFDSQAWAVEREGRTRDDGRKQCNKSARAREAASQSARVCGAPTRTIARRAPPCGSGHSAYGLL